jgi:hypothetical protein
VACNVQPIRAVSDRPRPAGSNSPAIQSPEEEALSRDLDKRRVERLGPGTVANGSRSLRWTQSAYCLAVLTSEPAGGRCGTLKKRSIQTVKGGLPLYAEPSTLVRLINCRVRNSRGGPIGLILLCPLLRSRDAPRCDRDGRKADMTGAGRERPACLGQRRPQSGHPPRSGPSLTLAGLWNPLLSKPLDNLVVFIAPSWNRVDQASWRYSRPFRPSDQRPPSWGRVFDQGHKDRVEPRRGGCELHRDFSRFCPLGGFQARPAWYSEDCEV